MCLLAVAYKIVPGLPLVITANRDESYLRPTEPMHWWPKHPILAGRDLEAGGTWMGLTRSGRFSAITNIRNAAMEKKPKSRGDLVFNFLTSNKSSEDWAAGIAGEVSDYSGFNLLVFDGDSLLYINNYNNKTISMEPGLYALSNHLLDTPWPKVEHARNNLQALLQRGNVNLDSLLELLTSQQTYAPHLLPTETGLSPEVEEVLSSPFIISDTYGTRASTAVIITDQGEISVAEQSFEQGKKTGFETFSFQQAP